MSQLDDLLERSRKPGAFVERKRFSLSRDKAVEKQREYALRDDPKHKQYILELVQAAVLGGARYIAIDIRPEHVLLAFTGGKLLQIAELEGLFDHLFADHGDAEVRHLVQMAIGLNALLKRPGKRTSTRAIRIESGDGERSVRMDLDPDGKGQLGVPEEPLRGTYVLVERTPRLRHRFQPDEILPEQTTLESFCRYTPVPIFLNGSAPFGYTARPQVELFGIPHQRSFQMGPLRGVVGIPLRPWEQKTFQLVVGGCVVTELELPELGSIHVQTSRGAGEAQLYGVICDDRLRKTADQADIVRDQRFARMLREVQKVAAELVEEVTGQRPAQPVIPGADPDESPEERGKLALPERLRAVGPQSSLSLEQLVEESPRPLFWISPGDHAALEPLADPARFPYRVLVVEEGEARTLADHLEDAPLQKLGTVADVEFVRRVLRRRLPEVHTEIPLQHHEWLTGTLTLSLHLEGPPPPWSDAGSVPVVLSVRDRAQWTGGLTLRLVGLSAHLRLDEAQELDEVRLVGALTALLERHAWRVLLQADPEHPVAQALWGQLLERRARPQLVRTEARTELHVALPPEWGPDARGLLARPLSPSGVTLPQVLAGASSEGLLPKLALRFGPVGGLTEGPRLLRLMRAKGFWQSSAQDGDAVIQLGGAPRVPEGWRSVAPPIEGVWAAVKRGAPPLGEDAWERLEEALAAFPDHGLHRGPLPALRLASWQLRGAPLDEVLVDVRGTARPLSEWLERPEFGVVAAGGVQTQAPGTVPLAFPLVAWLEDQLDRALPLRFDDPPETWLSLVDPDAEGEWLLRQALRIPGVGGWLGLRRAFDPVSGVLVRDGALELEALDELDEQAPCHGLAWSTDGRSALTGSQRTLLGLAALQLYQELAEGLTARRFHGDSLGVARRYGMRFAALCWARGRAHLGTARLLARAISVERPDGSVWGTLEAWLDSPEGQRPELPVQLPASAAISTPTRRVQDSFEERVAELMGQLGAAVQVHVVEVEDRGAPVRVRSAGAGQAVLQLNRSAPQVQRALAGTGPVREILLLEAARLLVRWSSSALDEPLSLHELQQILLARRLRLR